jgi:hypothetical protein
LYGKGGGMSNLFLVLCPSDGQMSVEICGKGRRIHGYKSTLEKLHKIGYDGFIIS